MKATTRTKNSKKEDKNLYVEAIVENEEGNRLFFFPKKYKKHVTSLFGKKELFLGGGALVVATFIANILNYIFNAYLGRVLSFNDFALLGLMGSFYSFASIFFGTYSATVNFRSGFLIGQYGDGAGYGFWKYMRKRVLYLSLLLVVLWFLLMPLLMEFFHTSNIYLFALFAIVLFVGFMSNVNQGFLFSKMMFGSLAITNIADPVTKLTATALLVSLSLQSWTFAAIPAAALVIFIVSSFLISKQASETKTKAPAKEIHSYPRNFFFVTLLGSFSSVAYFTFDIFLAKHFLSPEQAGQYILVSLVGKMIFFLGNITGPFIIPIVSRYEGAKKDSSQALAILLAGTLLLCSVGFVLFGIFGYITVPILYGAKAQAIVPYVPLFTFGMLCYTISNVLVSYYLARRIYTFTLASSLLILLQVGLILVFHDSVATIARVMSFVLMANLLLVGTLHIGVKYVKVFERNWFTTLLPAKLQSK